MRKFAAYTAIAAACVATRAFAVTPPSSVNLGFGGSGSSLAATGFDGVYTEDTSGYSVGGGSLTINTEGGDTYGAYETDPDTAKNMFFSNVNPLGQTVEQATVTVSNLNANFQGGGIWMGTDQDHYARLGVFHNSFLQSGTPAVSTPIGVELLRENQDRWSGATPPGQGDDIVSNATGLLGSTDPQTGSLTVILRLTETGNTVVGAYSLDNGTTFLPAGTFSGFALPGDPQGNGSNTEENGAPGTGDTLAAGATIPALNGLKVGVYAFGGPDPQIAATYAFDTFSAVSTSAPEPASIGLLALGALAGMRRRRGR